MKIPKYAKEKAREALAKRKTLPEYKKFGMTKIEAEKLEIASGVERAKQIIRSKRLSLKDVKRVCAFRRFLRRKRTEKIQGAIDLWGGERFIKKSCKYLQK